MNDWLSRYVFLSALAEYLADDYGPYYSFGERSSRTPLESLLVSTNMVKRSMVCSILVSVMLRLEV